MGPDPFGNEEQFDRPFQLISTASLWLAWYEMTTLWPLEQKERKEFRKNLLLRVSAVIDDELRSGPFMEMLRRSFAMTTNQSDSRSNGRHPHAREEPRHSDSRTAGTSEVPDAAFQELLRLIKEQSEREQARAGNASARCASLEKQEHQQASQSNTEGDLRDEVQTPRTTEASERLIRELQETNTQLRELLAMQRKLLEQATVNKHQHYEESRNGS